MSANAELIARAIERGWIKPPAKAGKVKTLRADYMRTYQRERREKCARLGLTTKGKSRQ